MAVTYYALLTTIGAGKLANATALGTTLKITQLALGDGGGSVPTPDASRTTLVNEVRRAPLNQLSIDAANPAQIIAEQVIPEDVGGWWIREMGLYDESGALIAYANCAPSYKPLLAEGSGRTQTVRMVLIVSNTASVELKIDPSVVLATREYVDGAIVSAINKLDYKQSVRVATTASITLSGLQTIDGIALAAGDRVLVKNQTTASQNGLYVAATGAWARASDADTSAEVTPALVVVVEAGTSLADTIWQLITDAPIVLGTTALTFQDITNGLARLASPVFTGTPTAPTAVVGTSTQQLATTAFVQAATSALATIASPAFTGTPTAPTPSQFDASTKLATMEAVVRAAGSIRSNNAAAAILADTTLSAADAGKWWEIQATCVVTLPLWQGSEGGSVFYFKATKDATLKASGSETILSPAGTIASGTLKVLRGEMIALLHHNASGWHVISGGFASDSYANQLQAPGYQKLPNGLILQWGGSAAIAATSNLSITFPITFPTNCLLVFTTYTNYSQDPSGTSQIGQLRGSSASAFTLRNLSTASAQYNWLAIGY